MILRNLFAGQQWRNIHREQISGHGEKGEEGEMLVMDRKALHAAVHGVAKSQTRLSD